MNQRHMFTFCVLEDLHYVN